MRLYGIRRGFGVVIGYSATERGRSYTYSLSSYMCKLSLDDDDDDDLGKDGLEGYLFADSGAKGVSILYSDQIDGN